jgi:cell division protein FtsW
MCQNSMWAVVLSAKATKIAASVFFVTVLALLTFGFVMLASTSTPFAYRGDAFYIAKRQALWLGIGLVACVATARVDYHYYRKYAWPLFFGAVLLLIGVLVLGKRVNGAIRWYAVGPWRLQPSEFAKYVLVIVLAFWLEQMQRRPKGQLRPRIQHWWWGVVAPLLISSGLALLVLREPDFGTAVLLFAVTLVMMWIGGVPWPWMAAIVGAGLLCVAAALVAIFNFGMFHEYYQVQRLIHWWRGDDLQGSNYQQYMAMLAFGVGATGGQGLGNSIMKMAYLPEAHTDFILPIIGEELGLVATLAVVVAFGVLVISGLQIASRAPDLFGWLLGCGIMTIIGLQVIINIAVVTNVIPNKGMALPFISYGGSNLVMTLAGIGVIFSIFRRRHVRPLDLFKNGA